MKTNETNTKKSHKEIRIRVSSKICKYRDQIRSLRRTKEFMMTKNRKTTKKSPNDCHIKMDPTIHIPTTHEKTSFLKNISKILYIHPEEL